MLTINSLFIFTGKSVANGEFATLFRLEGSLEETDGLDYVFTIRSYLQFGIFDIIQSIERNGFVMNKKRLYLIGIAAFIACIICFALVYIRFSAKSDTNGQKAYTLEVSDGNKNIRYSGKTDSEYLSGLMEELKNTDGFEYESEIADFGMYITEVNGIKADESKKTYWAIYVNGEYGQHGADSQPVNDGDAYVFKLESYE